MRDENGRMTGLSGISGTARPRCSACWRCWPPRPHRPPSRSAPTTATRGPPAAAASMRRCASSSRRRLRPRGGGGGGGLRGGTTAGGGLQGRQTQGTIAPIPIAIPFFLGPDPKLAADIADVVHGRPRQLGSVRAARPRLVPRAGARRQRRAALSRLALHPRRRARRRRCRARRRRPHRRAVPPVGRRLRDASSPVSASRPARRTGAASGTSSPTRSTSSSRARSGYFDTRVVFVDETGPKDRRVKRLAIMDQDGFNVRLLQQGPGAGADAALQSDQSRDHLHVVHRRSAARVPHEPRDGTARDRRRFPGDDVRAALLARRPARHHEPAGGRQLDHLRDGPALEAEAPADAGHVDRHQPELLARRAADRVRNRPRRARRRST